LEGFFKRYTLRGRDAAKADENLYRYCGDGPTDGTDPSGYDVLWNSSNGETIEGTVVQVASNYIVFMPTGTTLHMRYSRPDYQVMSEKQLQNLESASAAMMHAHDTAEAARAGRLQEEWRQREQDYKTTQALATLFQLMQSFLGWLSANMPSILAYLRSLPPCASAGQPAPSTRARMPAPVPGSSPPQESGEPHVPNVPRWLPPLIPEEGGTPGEVLEAAPGMARLYMMSQLKQQWMMNQELYGESDPRTLAARERYFNAQRMPSMQPPNE